MESLTENEIHEKVRECATRAFHLLTAGEDLGYEFDMCEPEDQHCILLLKDKMIKFFGAGSATIMPTIPPS